MLIDKDAAVAAIRRLEINGPQMIWSSDAIGALVSWNAENSVVEEDETDHE